MKPHSSGFGRWFVRRLVAVPTAGVFLAAGLAGASPAAGVPPAPHAAQRQTQSPPPAKSDGINWDFSVMERWHLCAPDDVNDCTLQCGRGHLPSCVYLGNIYLAGKLVPRDVVRAAEAYELPCGFAFGAACFNRAQIYAQQHDDEHAATYYARACDADYTGGCFSLGVAYDEGKGVPHDAARAASLYEKACDGGDPRACSNLGILTMHGDGVAADKAAGARLFEKACAAGNAWACGNLGSCYESGQGEPRNSARAAQLHRRACEGGAKMFCR